MAAKVYAGVLTAEALRALVEQWRAQAPYAVLEQVDDIDFPTGDEPINPEAWDEGRIFGPGFEVRWLRDGTGFRTVLTREDDGDGEGLPEVESLDGYERQERAYYLWGEEDTRIGRRMDYRAIPGKGRAQLVVAEFYDERGDLRHWRYVRFQREGSQ